MCGSPRRPATRPTHAQGTSRSMSRVYSDVFCKRISIVSSAMKVWNGADHPLSCESRRDLTYDALLSLRTNDQYIRYPLCKALSSLHGLNAKANERSGRFCTQGRQCVQTRSFRIRIGDPNGPFTQGARCVQKGPLRPPNQQTDIFAHIASVACKNRSLRSSSWPQCPAAQMDRAQSPWQACLCAWAPFRPCGTSYLAVNIFWTPCAFFGENLTKSVILRSRSPF